MFCDEAEREACCIEGFGLRSLEINNNILLFTY